MTNPLANKSWTSIAIMVGMPVLLGFVAWVIHILADPPKWCSVSVGSGNKIALAPISDCSTILLSLIDGLRGMGYGLLGTVAVAFIAVVIRDLKVGVSIHGPGGFGFSADNDAADGAAHVAKAADKAAEEVKNG